MRIYFGGTFDPVHVGHLQLAEELAALFGSGAHHEDEVALSAKGFSSAKGFIYLMPCYKAVHKADVQASAAQRLAMLELALADRPALDLDTRELMTDQPSYTFNSLSAIREEIGDEALCFVMGTDSLIGFPSWYRADSMAAITNLIVVQRPESSFALDTHQKMSLRQNIDKVLDLGFQEIQEASELERHSAGCLLSLKLSLLDISSSQVRRRVRENQAVNHLVGDRVAAYINETKLYQNQEA